MRYNSFNKYMGNFVHAVKLEGHFKNSNISTDDLAFFIPSLKNWNRNFYFPEASYLPQKTPVSNGMRPMAGRHCNGLPYRDWQNMAIMNWQKTLQNAG